MNKYKCLKCNVEFEQQKGDPKCPKCGANNYYGFNIKRVECAKQTTPLGNVQGGVDWDFINHKVDIEKDYIAHKPESL